MNIFCSSSSWLQIQFQNSSLLVQRSAKSIPKQFSVICRIYYGNYYVFIYLVAGWSRDRSGDTAPHEDDKPFTTTTKERSVHSRHQRSTGQHLRYSRHASSEGEGKGSLKVADNWTCGAARRRQTYHRSRQQH